MRALSLTAIGLRPLDECLQIADQLTEPLSLDALELAVGVVCEIDADYGDWPLVVHDSALWRSPDKRLRLDPLLPSTWKPYRDFIADHDVRLVGIHAPARRRCTLGDYVAARDELEQYLGVPVATEVMPESTRWCSDFESLIDRPLLLDVSHVLIWEGGDAEAAALACRRIIDEFEIAEFHLSHNDGRRDSHDLVPQDAWFEGEIAGWASDAVVTWESLPVDCARFERLDVASRWSNGSRDVGALTTS